MLIKKPIGLACTLSLVFAPVQPAVALTDGDDILYAVKATSGATQDWGTIAPSTGTFTSITEISPTGLGWPLGGIGSQPDPINGYVFTRQLNFSNFVTDVMAIKKNDGSTKWLGIGPNSMVVGYDSKTNQLIYRVSENSSNTIKTYNMVTTETSTIGTFGGSNITWQAGGIGAVDSFGRTAFQLRPAATSTLYKINLDDGTETTVSIGQYVTTIAWDSKEQKLYGLYDSNSNGAYRVAEINTNDGSLTNVGSADTVLGMSNYVQLIAPNDQRYYIQESPLDIRVISLTDGSSLGTFSAPLRLMPPGAVVIGSGSANEEVEFDINDPSSTLIKLGSNTVDYTGTSISSGETLVLEGTLKVNGIVDNSTATVSSGASLAGAGTVGGIINNGNLEPGNSIGTLNVSGGVTLNTGSVLVIEVDAAGNSDKIVATGAVTAGGTLRLSPASGTYSDGQQYTIITGSSVSGAFSTVTVLSCSGTASASYGSTAITVTLSNCGLNAPKGRETISSYVNDLSSSASGDLNTVLSALNTLSDDQYNEALDALDYNTSGAIASVAQSQISSINSVIGQRVAAASGGDKVASMLGFMTRLPANDYLEGLSFEDRLKKMGATGWWALSHGGVGDKKPLKKLGVNGYDYTFVGTTFGYDKQHDNHINGTAVTIQIGSIDSDNGEGDTDHTTFSASKYLSRTLTDGTRQSLTGSFAVTHVDSNRRVRFASIDRTAKASYDSIAFDGAAEHSYSPRQMLGATHNFSLQGGITFNFQEGFTERGADSVNLKVAGSQTQVARAGLVDTIYWSGNEDRSSIPFVTLGIHASHHLGDTHTKQRFVNQNSFTSESDKKTNAYGEVGFGFLGDGDDDTEISFVTKGKFSDKLTEFSAMLQYTKKF